MSPRRREEDNLRLNSKEQQDGCAYLEKYFLENFQMELGNLECSLFLDFISEKIGKYYYNQGVAQTLGTMSEKIEDCYLLLKDVE